jgi:predicted PurR-regulated permease PerM
LGAPGIPPPRPSVYRLSHVRISTVGNKVEGYPTSTIRQDLTRTTLAVICILVLIAGSLWILLPFLAATVWATMLVVATWPILESLERRLGNRRAPAVAVMTLGLLLLLVIPLWGAIQTIAEHAQEVTDLAKKLAESGLPQPPEWVGKLPLVGKKLSETLSAWADAGPAGLEAKLGPYVSAAALWVFDQAGSLGGTLVQFLLVVILSAVMYASGETAARGVRRFGRRLAGPRGEDSVLLAGKAIRSVALGVGVTAVVQTLLGAIGLAVAGVPFASVLSAVMLMLCIAQLGPALVLFPAVGWMYWTGENAWATFLLVWSIFVSALDNILRPMLIKKGADLPLLLIFAGVIGGLIGFGLIGIFVGPVVLAVTYTLLESWIKDDLERAPEA